MDAYLLGKVTELDKTTLGDIALWKINNLSREELFDIIKSKDRTEYAIQWDLEGNLELIELHVCDDGDPYNSFKMYKLLDRYEMILNNKKGFKEYSFNGIEYLFIRGI